MSYDETMSRLVEMESRYHDGFSSTDRNFLERLYQDIYGKPITVTNCSNCYRDAYILLITKLKRDKTMPNKPNYVLKAGVLLHPVCTSNYYSNPLPSDDIAEDYLAQFPDQISIFASYPNDWEERVEKRKAVKAAEEAARAKAINEAADNAGASVLSEASEYKKAAEEAKDLINQLNEERDSLKVRIAELEEANKSLSLAVDEANQKLEDAEAVSENSDNAGISAELEAVKAELVAAQSKLDELKYENRSLKAANTKLKKRLGESDDAAPEEVSSEASTAQ